ncbi:response regulator transcription factor [Variovorax saccharolyticus]|uniref:response regulator transcription factor n=1 Tax=Variovorax saccharolyticus TaxID=3053516 RepID=UPI002575A7EE|nr:response regulator [Variovorax sp. J22R187]MDM0022708.1 response regulator [Variovorax sp. J22R187]
MSTGSHLCVAVVDDDTSVARSLGRLLRASGMQPITYASAEEFLADTERPRFDCLVLDIQLGGMSGLDLAKHLPSLGPVAPFIIITAHDDDESRGTAENLGAFAYFRKSDAGSAVLDAIRRAAATGTR